MLLVSASPIPVLIEIGRLDDSGFLREIYGGSRGEEFEEFFERMKKKGSGRLLKKLDRWELRRAFLLW